MPPLAVPLGVGVAAVVGLAIAAVIVAVRSRRLAAVAVADRTRIAEHAAFLHVEMLALASHRNPAMDPAAKQLLLGIQRAQAAATVDDGTVCLLLVRAGDAAAATDGVGRLLAALLDPWDDLLPLLRATLGPGALTVRVDRETVAVTVPLPHQAAGADVATLVRDALGPALEDRVMHIGWSECAGVPSAGELLDQAAASLAADRAPVARVRHLNVPAHGQRVAEPAATAALLA